MIRFLRCDERGISGLELIITASVVVAVVMIGVAGARAVGADSGLVAVAGAAARAGVAAPPGGAQSAAVQAADDAAAGFGLDLARLHVEPGSTLSAGGAYTVQVTYVVSLAPMPGSLTLTAERSQPVDPFRP